MSDLLVKCSAFLYKVAQLRVLDLREQAENVIKNMNIDKPEIFSGVLNRLEQLKDNQDPKALYDTVRDAVNYVPVNNRGDLEKLNVILSQLNDLEKPYVGEQKQEVAKSNVVVPNETVKMLQKFLNSVLVPSGKWVPVEEDGKYGPETIAAMKQWAKLNSVSDKNINQLFATIISKAKSVKV